MLSWGKWPTPRPNEAMRCLGSNYVSLRQERGHSDHRQLLRSPVAVSQFRELSHAPGWPRLKGEAGHQRDG
jgi:hypothetical protein